MSQNLPTLGGACSSRMGVKPRIGLKPASIRNGYNVAKVPIRHGYETISLYQPKTDLQVRRIAQFEGSDMV